MAVDPSRHQRRLATRAIHVGSDPDPITGAVVPPIHQVSTFAQPAPGEHTGFEYARTGNPTRAALEEALASVEGVAPDGPGGALTFGSGMAAVSTLLLTLRPGDHMILGDDAYGGTHRVVTRVMRDWGLQASVVDTTDLDAVKQALRAETRMVWVETPSNPRLRVADVSALAELAHGAGARCVVDSTFATPALQQPLALGADVVVHSATKYLGGHSDVVLGALVTADADVYERVKFLQNAVGAVPGPLDCWLVHRGLRTLPVRVRAHSAGGQQIAEFLAGHPGVAEVFYPGLPGDPGHELAARQMHGGFGGMVSFRPVGGEPAARRLVEATQVFILAESLGGVESLIELPSVMTHASVAGTEAAVPPDLVRLSVGLEHPDDLVDDLTTALAAAR